jgi:prefoldin subunit 5
MINLAKLEASIKELKYIIIDLELQLKKKDRKIFELEQELAKAQTTIVCMKTFNDKDSLGIY